jgi:hypothetical protein
MKLVNYKCKVCGKEKEYIFQDSEWEVLKNSPNENDWKILDECLCGGNLEIFNFKNNKQTWKFFDKK